MTRLKAWGGERLHDRRLIKNSVLSALGWVLLYGVFYLEVHHLDWNSQAAKLSLTPIGAPVGLAIYWAVFGDLIKVIHQAISWKRAIAFVTSRFAVVKVSCFLLNQVAYAMLLHQAGLPYWLANLLVAPVMYFVFYTANVLWVCSRHQSGPKTATL